MLSCDRWWENTSNSRFGSFTTVLELLDDQDGDMLGQPHVLVERCVVLWVDQWYITMSAAYFSQQRYPPLQSHGQGC